MAAGELYGEERKLAAALAELEDVRRELRSLCAELGCNDWPDDLHLGDVIEKHLGRHLRDFAESADGMAEAIRRGEV